MLGGAPLISESRRSASPRPARRAAGKCAGRVAESPATRGTPMDFLQAFVDFMADVDLVPLILAVVLGGAIGFERELNARPAGLRTHILVCLSATMVIGVSRSISDGSLELGETGRVVFDPNRMGAGIVTGIGFLGAATVMRAGDVLRGLTTAACIWFVAGLGIALGTHHYALSIVATIFVLFVLTVVHRATEWIEPLIYRRLIVTSRGRDLSALAEELRAELVRSKMRVMDITARIDVAESRSQLSFFLALKNEFQSPGLLERIARFEGVKEATWELVLDR